MGNLLIKGGKLVDGTGASARYADIRVRGGLIEEIGPDLDPCDEAIIDAAGAIVAPGFIDSHTHFDATIFWDPICDPMPQHGVTTVVAGNCSLGLAPIREQDRRSQVDVYGYIEDMPTDLLNDAIPWSWESYGDYADALSNVPLGVNLMTFVGHTQIRCYVMGDAAWERTATAREIEAMADELDKALGAGAIGMSFSLFDKDRQSRPVPSCLADDAELDALMAVLGKHGATFEFVPGDNVELILEHLDRLGALLGKHNVTGLYNILLHMESQPDRAERIVARLEELRSQGTRIFGMVSPRQIELSIGFEQTMCFIDVPSWNDLVQAPREARLQMIQDEEWRSLARKDADERRSTMFPFKRAEMLKISSAGNPACREWIGKTLAELTEARGGHVSDVLADWLIENDFDTSFALAIANTIDDEVASLLKSPVSIVSASDAGAHLQMFCAAGDATLLLTKYVRERGDLTIEQAVHALTGRQGEILGIADRGVLAPGKAADITVFALDELHYGPEVPASDLPGERARLTREPGGYRYTIVNGEVVQQGGKATGALPASWLAVTA